MSFWSELFGGGVPGLLGKPYVVDNEERRFGESPSYVLMKVEAPHDMEFTPLNGEPVKKEAGEEFVLAFTPDQFCKALSLAESQPEDVKKFLEQHAESDAED